MASRAKPRAVDLSDPAPAATFAPPPLPDTPPPTPPAAPPDTNQPPTALANFRPVKVKARHDGWTVARQRKFLIILAETGSISLASRDAGVSARSAYRLRQRPDAQSFAAAWDQALRMATLRLTTLAFERAVTGTVREIWRNGELVGQVRAPNDKMLMFLLQTLLPRTGGNASRLDEHDRGVNATSGAFPAALDRLADHDMDMVPIAYRDFHPDAPGSEEEDW